MKNLTLKIFYEQASNFATILLARLATFPSVHHLINFALSKQGFVTLKVYDLLGREVRTLVNEVKSAGQFSIEFNASELPSGIYFYRLESNGFTAIKKMILIK